MLANNFAGRVELIGEKSTLYEHCEAIVNFEKALKNTIEGHYRKKKDYKNIDK